jgi:hypothetical protein
MTHLQQQGNQELWTAWQANKWTMQKKILKKVPERSLTEEKPNYLSILSSLIVISISMPVK